MHTLEMPSTSPSVSPAVGPAPSPALAYLARLGASSRRTQAAALRTVLGLLGIPASPDRFAWHRLTPAQALALRARLAETCAPATANRILAAVRGVLTEAWRFGLISADLRDRLTGIPTIPGRREPKGRALTEAEYRALDAAAAKSRHPGRDRALLATLCFGGLRRAEAVGLRRADVAVEGGSVRLRVVGKGSKERTVYLAGDAAAHLAAHLASSSSDPIFGLADPDAVWKLLRRLARAAGVAPFGPHDLRRTFASRALDRGVDLATVQHAMGHADPRTTARYDRRGERALQEAAVRVAHL
jgi:integrase